MSTARAAHDPSEFLEERIESNAESHARGWAALDHARGDHIHEMSDAPEVAPTDDVLIDGRQEPTKRT
eukprot:1884953-Pyramimonas_sp.AAC.1